MPLRAVKPRVGAQGELAYVYAKACGIVGKSFLGKRLSLINSVSRLSDLDRLVFPLSSQDLPEKELLFNLEGRILRRAVDQILSILDSFAKPPELLVLLLRAYEYSDVKALLAALAAGEQKAPGHIALGRYGTVNFAAYPDPAKTFAGTEFAFLADTDIRGEQDQEGGLLFARLDRQYYTLLWEAVMNLPARSRETVRKILGEEISLRNAVWALRLRTYYALEGDELRERLVLIPGLSEDAEQSLSMSLDTRTDWDKWKRAAFLNPPRPDEHWQADPRYFQNAASGYLYRLSWTHLHRRPLSLDTACCFIKLKQFEEDLLTGVAEGLGLGMSARDVLTLLEVHL
jgi:vacuolar-type H+-ATPase subunit C/Vma6